MLFDNPKLLQELIFCSLLTIMFGHKGHTLNGSNSLNTRIVKQQNINKDSIKNAKKQIMIVSLYEIIFIYQKYKSHSGNYIIHLLIGFEDKIHPVSPKN